MDCKKAREMLSDYIDGCLDEEVKHEIEEHISGCTECRQEYEIISAILGSCSNFEEEDLPHDFERKLHERLLSETQNTKERRFGIRFNRINTAAAAVLILAISIGVVFSSGVLNLSSKKETGTAQINGLAADSASPKVAVQAPSAADNSVQYGITAKIPENGRASDKQDQTSGQGKSQTPDQEQGQITSQDQLSDQTQAPDQNQEVGIAANTEKGFAPRGITYNTAVVNLDSKQYDMYYQSIVSSIKELLGYPDKINPGAYILSRVNWDILYKKLIEEYSIKDISVGITDISIQYNTLKDEIAKIEENETGSFAGGESDIQKRLDEKRYELDELDKKVDCVYIVINRI